MTTNERNKQHKRWCGTLWCDQVALEELQSTVERECTYWVFQREACPNTGRLHYQGYFEFKSKRAHRGGKLCGLAGCWTVAKGSAEENTTYCSKLDSRATGQHDNAGFGDPPWVGGKAAVQGERTDLRALTELIRRDGLDELLKGPDAHTAARCV